MHNKILRAPYRLLLRLRGAWKKRFGVPPTCDSLADLQQWFDTPAGVALLNAEQSALNETLSCVFGYYLLQLGMDSRQDMAAHSRISHKFCLHPSKQGKAQVSALVDFNHLPLAPESVDVVVLHHVLDYSQTPHYLLREATRVIIPRGHLVILGFNPWSLWGVWSYCARFFSRRALWRNQYLRPGRLLDWLSLVDLEPIGVIQGDHSPQAENPKAISYLQWLKAWGKKWRSPSSGFYMIVARKDHLAMTPIKPSWQAVEPLGGLTVPRVLRHKSPSCQLDLTDSHTGHTKSEKLIEKRRNIH